MYQAAAMRGPPNVVDLGDRGDLSERVILWCVAAQRRMDALLVVIGLEVGELARKVQCIPEKYVIEKLPPDCPDEPFHKGMGRRRLQFVDLENAQIRLPAMKFEQWVMVGADIARDALRADGVICP